MKKLVILLTFFLISCSPNDTQEQKEKVKNSETETIISNEKKESALNESEKSSKKFEEELRLNFNKDIPFVYIKEVNNNSLEKRPMGGISAQNAYILDDEYLYLFHEEPLPTKDTDLIVMMEKFNYDYLLDYELHQSNTDNVSLDFSVDNEYVNNDNRLFQDSEATVRHMGDGVISLVLNGEHVELNPREEKEIFLSDNEIESKLIIKNYGLFNSIDNIMYSQLQDDETP